MPMNLLPENIDLNLTVWALMATAAIPMIWLLVFYTRRVASVARAVRRHTYPLPETPEGVSVIVHSSGNADDLGRLLESLFSQQYGGQMEVIVVNDGKNEEIKDVVTRMKYLRRLDNLYITFTPPVVRNISPRKLSVTLGAKAAHHPLLVMVDEQAQLPSDLWLARMTAPFADEQIQVVIGSALPDHKADKHRHGRRYRSFTHAADAVMWLSAAIRRRPYRGHGCNLAYRRSLFFDSRGFSSALNLRDGDDDIFINRVTTRDNTAAVVSRDAQVTYSHPSSRHEYRQRRPRRFHTARSLRKGSARFFGFSSLMTWLFVLLTVTAAAAAVYNRDWTQCGAVGAQIALLWLPICLTWRRTLLSLRARPATLTVPWMMLRRPFTNLRHKCLARQRRKEYYTWS